MGKDKKDKKEKKEEAVVEEKVEKKEKKAKKDKKEKVVEAVVEEVKSPKKDKKEKKRKAEEKEEVAEDTPKKEKKSKKSKKEEPEVVAEVEEPEASGMKVHSKAPVAVAAPAEATCEVFMGNLSFQIDEASLQEAFKGCGTISNCKWLEHQDTGKFKGCGFITFSSSDEAVKAVALNGTEVLGREIKVDFSQKPAGGGGGGGNREVRPMQAKPDGCNTLFAGNLSFDIDDDGMKAFFDGCGEISSIRWLTDRDTQQFKGCGFIEFADPDASLAKAAALNGSNLLGRTIRLDYAAPRAPKW